MGLWQAIKKRVSGNSSQDIDPNFKGSLQFYSPGQPIWTNKDYRGFVTNGYRKNPTVYTCINKITSAASGIKWKLYADQDKKKVIEQHPLLDLWKKPNPRMPGSGSFIEQVVGFWHMSGNSYIWAYRPDPQSAPLALWSMRPDRVKAVASETGIADYIYGYQSENPQILAMADTLHMKFAAYDDDIYGLSPIEVASYQADQQNETLGWNTALMQNAGRPASVFMSKNYLTVEQRNQIKDELRKKYSGKRNAGMPLVLEADLSWQSMSLTPLEMDFLKSYELNTRGIAAIFDIAPELIGDSAGKTFANVKEAREALYVENVLPKLDRMSDYLNAWLVPMYPDLVQMGAYFTYDKDDIEALQALYAAQKKADHDTARSDWMAGGIMLNEYRQAIGKDPIPNGNVFRFGAVLVSEESLEDYADQSLSEPASPPMPAPEPLNVPPALPAGKQPLALPAPAKSKKSLDQYGIYQPDDLEQQLQALRDAGTEYIMWQCSVNPCEICSINDATTIKVGDPFPSGHILPEAHPNCDCKVVPSTKPIKKLANNNELVIQASSYRSFIDRYL